MVDCSRSVQRRLEQLGRRRLTVGYGEQTVRETKPDYGPGGADTKISSPANSLSNVTEQDVITEGRTPKEHRWGVHLPFIGR